MTADMLAEECLMKPFRRTGVLERWKFRGHVRCGLAVFGRRGARLSFEELQPLSGASGETVRAKRTA